MKIQKLSELIEDLQRLQKKLNFDPDVYYKNFGIIQPLKINPYINSIADENNKLKTVVII